MSYAQAGIILGLIQGLTEFLPVSSSGHLILVPRVFGWPDQGLAVDAALHLGTLAALVSYFAVSWSASRSAASRAASPRSSWWGPFRRGWQRSPSVVHRASLRWPLLIAFTTAFWAIVAMSRTAGRPPALATSGSNRLVVSDPLERIGWGQGLAVGLAQAIALIPGTSRSGITITTASSPGSTVLPPLRGTRRFCSGFRSRPRPASRKRSTSPGRQPPGGRNGRGLVAILVSFLSGWFAVWFLVSYLKRRSLTPFVVYRLALAALLDRRGVVSLEAWPTTSPPASSGWRRPPLYREEVVTDRRVGSIRVLTPLRPDGSTDATRPVAYVGEAQLLTPAGVLPLVFEIDVAVGRHREVRHRRRGALRADTPRDRAAPPRGRFADRGAHRHPPGFDPRGGPGRRPAPRPQDPPALVTRK